MADNFETDAGTGGKIFASDDISSVDWPYAKLAFGPRNTAHEVEDAAAKRIPVKIGDGLGAGAVVAGQVSLSGAEAALTSIAARRFRVRALLENTDTIYLGPTGVTVGTGYPLEPGDIMEFQVSNLNVVHAIVAGGTQVLSYLGEV